jgi:hypothetical protein
MKTKRIVATMGIAMALLVVAAWLAASHTQVVKAVRGVSDIWLSEKAAAHH